MNIYHVQLIVELEPCRSLSSLQTCKQQEALYVMFTNRSSSVGSVGFAQQPPKDTNINNAILVSLSFSSLLFFTFAPCTSPKASFQVFEISYSKNKNLLD
jgi:hypothetical protein